MDLQIIEKNGKKIALLAPGQRIADARDGLDLIAAAQFEAGCDRIALPKEALSEEFFRLSTGLAGEMLQKFVNYRLKVAIYGDFSGYKSHPLQDFLRESNQGQAVFFVGSEQEAIDRLGQ